jgi:alanyl-tRNA synthetase
MKSSEIRSRFLSFFEARGHRVVPSSSLVPANDPTLLFSNAGMNQFKDVFLGRERRDYARACSSQKCVRAGGKHNDLEQVGRTTRHHTFFEMLGNFSFGDYFKREAIKWAWELVTKDFAIPRDKLYVTVFREDDEAAEIWAKDVRVPGDRIFRLDEKDNFWQMGETGPCGPCSEIHYDLGPRASDAGHADCKFPCDCGRYVELWNLVFMQFNRDEQGQMTPLPRPSIDTGAGLERLATALLNLKDSSKFSNYDTDLFRPLIQRAEELTWSTYGDFNPNTNVSLRIIADHARATTFLISDGVVPSNEGRGYVLRRIMRRAILHGQKLGVKEPFFYKLAGEVIQIMKDAYPELVDAERRIAKLVKHEETRFAHTVAVGLEEFEEYATAAKEQALAQRFGEFESERGQQIKPELKIMYGRYFLPGNSYELQRKAAEQLAGVDGAEVLLKAMRFDSNPRVSGGRVFRLYDTFGLPWDVIEDAARDSGVSLDREGFETEMQKQRERARASWKAAEKKVAPPVYQQIAEKQKTAFVGYAQTASTDCRIVALVIGGRGGSRTAPTMPTVMSVEAVGPGEEVEIVLDHTPFYAEAGGQVGDIGHFLAPDSDHEVAQITDTYYPVSGLIVHKAIARDTLRVGDTVTAVVDADRRNAIRRNHTATHLLHAALRKTLGTHVKQAGSLVAPDRLRFDFTHYAALDEQDLLDIEDLVNEHILKNEIVTTEAMDLDKAVDSGAMALFGERYADQVRVLSVEDFSKELCGGTHVERTGDIGLFKILSESSVAAGTRRIEAVTGTGVLEHIRKANETLALVSEALRSKPEGLIEAVEKLTESEKKLRKQLEAQQMKRAASEASDLVGQAREVKGVRVVAARVEVTDRSAMRQMVDDLRAKLESGVIVLASVADGKVALIAAVTKDLTAKLDAGKIVKQAAAYVEGSGGGRKDLAEAGGKNPSKLDESLQAVPSIIERML